MLESFVSFCVFLLCHFGLLLFCSLCLLEWSRCCSCFFFFFLCSGLFCLCVCFCFIVRFLSVSYKIIFLCNSSVLGLLKSQSLFLI